MININLLPVRQIKRRIRAKNELFVFVSTVVVLFGMLLAIHQLQARRLENAVKEARRLSAEKESFTPVLDKIKKIKATKESLDHKLKAIAALRQESGLAVRLMDEVAAGAPPGRMWLESYTFLADELKLTGIAMDNATVAQYMRRLRQFELIRDVELENSILTPVANLQLTKFSLRCRLAVAPPVAPPEKKEKKGKNP